MPQTKYIVVSDCRIGGKHVAKGTILDLDLDDPKEGGQIALLNSAGRIGLATPDNIRAVQEELRNEQAQARQAGQVGKRPAAVAA